MRVKRNFAYRISAANRDIEQTVSPNKMENELCNYVNNYIATCNDFNVKGPEKRLKKER